MGHHKEPNMKYMLMMNTGGNGAYQIAQWPEKDIKAHIAFMIDFSKKLAGAGELVGAEGLAGPDQAKRVRAGAGGEAITDGAKRQRDLRRRRQRRMATEEIQVQRVVMLVGGAGSEGDLLVGRNQADDELLAQPARRVGANLIGQAPRRDRDQPPAWVLGHSLARPLFRRGDQRFLDRVFAVAEVAVPPEQRAQDAGRVLQQDFVDQRNSGGGPLMTCRTSIGMFIGLPPGPGAADAAAAIAYARSGVSTSTIQ